MIGMSSNPAIPSTKRDLHAWLDRWKTTYDSGIELNFPYFTNDEYRGRRGVYAERQDTKWEECFYLNEFIRLANWKPRRKVMARIYEQARRDEKLTRFIKSHQKKISTITNSTNKHRKRPRMPDKKEDPQTPYKGEILVGEQAA
jgi:hypothetical protein